MRMQPPILSHCCAQAALATLIGTAASYAYLRWLIHDMGSLSRATVQPFQDARAAHAQPLRALVLALAAYRCQTQLDMP